MIVSAESALASGFRNERTAGLTLDEFLQFDNWVSVPFRLLRGVKNQINARMTATIRVSEIKVNMAETVTVSMKTNLRYVIGVHQLEAYA